MIGKTNAGNAGSSKGLNKKQLEIFGFKNVPKGTWKFMDNTWDISKRSDRIPLTIEYRGDRVEARTSDWQQRTDYLNGKSVLFTQVGTISYCWGKAISYRVSLISVYNGDLTAIQNKITSGKCYCYLQKV